MTCDTPLTDIELTEEQRAASRARGLAFGEHLMMGDGAEPELQSVNETLMPGGAVVTGEELESLTVDLPEELANAKVVKTLNEKRVRYDIGECQDRCRTKVFMPLAFPRIRFAPFSPGSEKLQRWGPSSSSYY